MHTSKLFLVIALLSLGGGGCHSLKPGPATRSAVFAQSEEIRGGDGFMILADRRVFATMAFLNATDFDDQPRGVDPVRQTVRTRVAENLAASPEKLQKWREYAKSRSMGAFCYQDFALSLQADYPFRRMRPDKDLGYPFTATFLRDFPEVLRDFWLAADLTNVWNKVRSDYIAELKKYDLAAMERQMASLWEYLRLPRQDTLTIVNVPNLLDAHYSAIGAGYEQYYYCVESPGALAYGLNVHEYLHLIVNPLVKTNFPAYQAKLIRYAEAGKRGPLSATYRQPVTFTCECLVRALDHRFMMTPRSG